MKPLDAIMVSILNFYYKIYMMCHKSNSLILRQEMDISMHWITIIDD